MRSTFLLYLLLFLAILACQREEETVLSETALPYHDTDNEPWIDSLIGHLTLEQKLGQFLVQRAHPFSLRAETELYQQVYEGKVGGIWLDSLPLLDYVTTVDSAKLLAPRGLFVLSEQHVLFNELLLDAPVLPNQETILATGRDSLFRYLRVLYAQQAEALGLNLVLGSRPLSTDSPAAALQQQRSQQLMRKGILSGLSGLSTPFSQKDSLQEAALITQLLRTGISTVVLPNASEEWAPLVQYLREQHEYQGLFLAKADDPAEVQEAFRSGADLIVSRNAPRESRRALRQVLEDEAVSVAEVDRRLKQLFLAKAWVPNGLQRAGQHPPKPFFHAMRARLHTTVNTLEAYSAPRDLADVWSHFYEENWEGLRDEIYRSSMTLLQDSSQFLPLRDLHRKRFRLTEYADTPFVHFRQQVAHYASVQQQYGSRNRDGSLAADVKSGSPYYEIIVLDDVGVSSERDTAFLRGLAQVKFPIVVNFGPTTQVEGLDSNAIILQLYARNRYSETLAAQALFGGQALNGRLPDDSPSGRFPAGSGLRREQIRLGYDAPQTTGIRPEQLVGIDAIARSAIREKSTPGCQIVVAHRGRIIYNKAFGYHTFRRRRPVQWDDLYDLASISKVAGTTLALMQLYEQGKIRGRDRLEEHLPTFSGTDIGKIRLRDLMTHQSGIQPHMPVLDYLRYRSWNNTACDSFFCKEQRGPYTVQIADDFYFDERYQDSIWQDIRELETGRRRRYRYSDVNFMLLQRVVETKTGQAMDTLLYQQFYRKLGLQHLRYRPLDAYPASRIVPTERDRKWRHQQIHGYVHDETAALFGGVAGHAGLFGNAESLAILMQLLLQNGQYAGAQWLQASTIETFTSSRHGNHRGLGFDKPSRHNRSASSLQSSAQSFGHTGFTGTCAWVDPDEELVYIFLSNRIYPNARNRSLFNNNVRARIHNVIYDALGSANETWPQLQY